MKFEADLIEGTVTGEFTLTEFQEVLVALNAQVEAKEMSPEPTAWRNMTPVFEMDVESHSRPGQYHHVLIWVDAAGAKHGYCPCEDHKYRKAWCKHLVQADMSRYTTRRTRFTADAIPFIQGLS